MRKRIALLAAISMLAVTMPSGTCFGEATDTVQAEDSITAETSDMPDEVINKPTSLTAEEFALIRKHPIRLS
ncbi:MAG: hypothetical protein IKF90_13230 [Parasporobacterium sp.]|nr:hypothetical protein [Parasporobacterium sp.]